MNNKRIFRSFENVSKVRIIIWITLTLILSFAIIVVADNETNNQTDNNETISNKTNITINNETNIKIHHNKYKGASTNFSNFSKEHLQNLDNVILENVQYGKIKFNENINISNETNLDLYINISQNLIEINSFALPNFNQSATLHLFNLSFNNPRILRNGEVCPEIICNKINYTNGTLIFTVSFFSSYSSEETPEEPAGGGSSGYTLVSIGTITLNTIEIVAPDKVFFGKQFTILLRPLNSEENITETDRVEIDIQNITVDSGSLTTTLDGTFSKRFTVIEQDIQNITIEGFAKQKGKEITEIITIPITQLGFFEDINVQGIGDWTRDFLQEYWLYLVIFGCIFLFITIAFVLINKIQKI